MLNRKKYHGIVWMVRLLAILLPTLAPVSGSCQTTDLDRLKLDSATRATADTIQTAVYDSLGANIPDTSSVALADTTLPEGIPMPLPITLMGRPS